MTDKKFTFTDYCETESIELIIPPGKIGESWMLPQSIKRTDATAKMRI